MSYRNLILAGNCSVLLIGLFFLSGKVYAQSVPVAKAGIANSTFCNGTCINFTDESTGNPTSWAWQFPGSDSAFSFVQNPTHICYPTPGVYDVILTVSNLQGSAAQYKGQNVINVLDCSKPPAANFSMSDSSVCAGTCITFFDSSKNALTRMWKFYSDTGTITTDLQGPFKVCYPVPPGKYKISLTDSNNAGATTVIKMVTVNNCLGGLTINSVQHDVCAGHSNSFSASYSGGIGPVQLMWHFTGGTPEYDTTNAPVTVTYNSPGNFPVELISVDSTGNADTVTSTIRVLNCSASSIHPGAVNGAKCLGTKFNLLYTTTGSFFTDNDFVAYITDTVAGSVVSIPVGTVYSHVAGSISVFVSNQLSPGTHKLYIKSTDPALTGDTTLISVAKCDSTGKCSINFSLTPDAVLAHHWNLVYNELGKSPVTLTWNWGDNTTSTGNAPSHIYSTAGSYTICVSMVDDSGCTSSFCDSSFYLFRLDGSDTMIEVNVQNSNTGTGISPISSANNVLSIYPNPAESQLTVSSNQLAGGAVQILNVLGEILMTKKPAGNKTTVDVSQLTPGVYFLSVKYADGNYEVRKFVKE